MDFSAGIGSAAVGIAIAAVSLAVLAGYVIAGRRGLFGPSEDAQTGNRLEAVATQLAASQSELAGRLAQLSESVARSQSELARSLNDRLDGVARQVGINLGEQAEKSGQALSELRERLSLIDQAQTHLSELSSQVIGLQDILDNKQRRGQFGEQILETLIQDALPAGIFEFQATLSNRTRVDCLVRLPNPPGPIAIDSKFPLESYRALINAQDNTAEAAARQSFKIALKKHITDIAEKYVIAGETAEGALLFIPSEAIYAELHAGFPDLIDQARKLRVWPVSPSTLMAILTSVRALIRDSRIRAQTHLIQKHVMALVEDIRRLETRVSNLRTHFVQAEDDIRTIEISTNKIVRKIEQIGEIEAEEVQSETLPSMSL